MNLPSPASLPPTTINRPYSMVDVAMRFLSLLPDLGVIGVVGVLAHNKTIEGSMTLLALLAVLAGRLNPAALTKLGATHAGVLLPFLGLGALVRRFFTVAIIASVAASIPAIACSPAEKQTVKTIVDISTTLCKDISAILDDGSLIALCATESEIAKIVEIALLERATDAGARNAWGDCKAVNAACLTAREIARGIGRTLATRKALLLRDAGL